jgi:hypothetical protein
MYLQEYDVKTEHRGDFSHNTMLCFYIILL